MKRSLFNPRNFTKSKTSAKWFPLLLFLTVLVLPSLSMGQAGSLDPLFGINGIVTTANTGANAAVLQSDGKIVVAGGIAIQQNFQQPGLLRYNTNGTLDPSFGTGGEVLIGGTNAGPAFAVAIQTDGKILTAAPGNLRLKVFPTAPQPSKQPDSSFRQPVKGWPCNLTAEFSSPPDASSRACSRMASLTRPLA
ncbi:MAG: hypothetical protein AUH08_04145 [Verrucomicrobia bacterium 13_2_20CM_54_12]|nr:MAG: hypothetical protein AUH08_04145 [Verrucomicrobia bacterium 13_2_20CM_54_12]